MTLYRVYVLRPSALVRPELLFQQQVRYLYICRSSVPSSLDFDFFLPLLAVFFRGISYQCFFPCSFRMLRLVVLGALASVAFSMNLGGLNLGASKFTRGFSSRLF